MMHTILMIIATYSIAYAIKEASLLDRPRRWLIGLHPFFFNLLECYYCVGFYAGLIVYALGFETFHIRELILWGFIGSITSLILSLIVDKFFGWLNSSDFPS